MSKQPLTNATPAIIIIARTQYAVDEELKKYNFAQDGFAVPPTITKHIYLTSVAFIVDPPNPALPCVILGDPEPQLRRYAQQWCTNFQTMADALKMVNNEYAIRRDQIKAGTVRDRTGDMP